jgi:YidC/Oxa1 family membrane protein insertase
MEKEEQRNFIIAMVLMLLFVFGYQSFVLEPAQRKFEAQEASKKAAGQSVAAAATVSPAAPLVADVPRALQLAARVRFDATSVDGSIRLAGARLDDLSLKKHFLKTDKKEEVRLLRPEEAPYGFFATYYWADGATLVAGRNSPWTLVSGTVLSPATPVTLRLVADGTAIDRVISVDDDYMFTFKDTVTNTSATLRELRPIGALERHGKPEDFLKATDPASALDASLAHMGLMGVINNQLILRKYDPLVALKKISNEGPDGTFASATGGWWALTDKYWMGALVPAQDRAFSALVNKTSLASGGPIEIRTEGTPLSLAPGASATIENRIFAGAKRFEVLRGYEKSLPVPRFVDAIDWGWAFFMTKPFFYILNWLFGMLGSFGLAILALTVIIKTPLVPLFNASYKSMAKLKKLQEPMAEIRERFKSDPQRAQQETLKLMKTEGANPLGGCLPILFTIPIFYALYKTLFVTIEMRHAPFLFMKDLSAPDPTALGNLFGLLPWAAADVKAIPFIGFIIGIGILPVLYGLTMAALQTLSPPPPDKMQANIIMLMPLVFTFVFGGFAAGLVIYWVWSNVLSFIQQYVIMRRNGVDTEIGKFIKGLLTRKTATPG